MCGILLRVSHNPPAPHIFTSTSNTSWTCLDEEFIFSNFIQPSLNVQLSMADESKLNNIARLKELQLQLNSAKNQIKQTEEFNQKLISIQNEIAKLHGDFEVEVSETKSKQDDVFESLVPLVARRGPNYVAYEQHEKENLTIQTFSSVLSLRSPFTPQPAHVLNLLVQFNGELYNAECMLCNDTEFLRELLKKNMEKIGREKGILHTIETLEGEFALSIYDPETQKIYFCRDILGRRSLAFRHNSESGEFILSSVADDGFEECESKAVHVFSMKNFRVVSISRTNDYFSMLKPNLDLSMNKQEISTVVGLETVLDKACAKRQRTIHPLHAQAEEANLAILFSGGLDCTVLAGLIAKNRILTEGSGHIDLLTVGFENPRTGLGAHESPDRMLSKKSWFHLAKLFDSPLSRFRLVEVNVSYKEWLAHRQVVKDLMYPARTEMDLSIAIAFYFASRGGPARKWELRDKLVEWSEFCNNEPNYATVQEDYVSNAKVLFSGLGADETFAGYSRHEAVLNGLEEDSSLEDVIEAYTKLNELLLHDIKVIESRNLGRDDRVISCWGKELRYPYLDEEVVKFVTNEIPPHLKLHYSWETRKTKKGSKRVKVPVRKYILRQLAVKLELNWVADEMKRAIQFGAKSAKMEIGQGRAKGTDSIE